MQVATSRLDIVNETDAFTQKVQHQADHLRQLKKRAMSIPVNAPSSAQWEASAHQNAHGKKEPSGPGLRPRLSGLPGGLVNSSIFRFMIEILITLAFPSLKKLGFDLANKKILSLIQIPGAIDGLPARQRKNAIFTAVPKVEDFLFFAGQKRPLSASM